MKTKIVVLISVILMTAFVQQSYSQDGKKKKTETTRISASMHCQACADNITTNLMLERGIKSVNADPVSKLVEVVYLPQKTNPEKIAENIRQLGYSASVIVE